MRRVSVVGNSGSGKTKFSRELARVLAVPHVELDAIFHGPEWSQLPIAEFRARVGDIAKNSGWVVDGNYQEVRDLVWSRADTVVWIDLPRRTVMRRIISRTLRRVTLRRQLWNGNRERWRSLFSRDPNTSVVAWAWTQHSTYVERYSQEMRDAKWNHVTFFRLMSPREVEHFLRNQGAAT